MAIRAYALGICVASFWNTKAKLALQGRKDIFTTIRAALVNNTRPVVWMHSASLGEFEQGRFLLENIRKQYPTYCLVVTFFSPSGYEVMKNYKGADHIFYLPFPTKRQAKRFISIVKPSLVLWIKYDYWYHYLVELKKRKIPVLLISAIFLKHHPFFRWYGPLYRKMLQCFSWMFVQTEGSAKRLAGIGFEQNVSVNGDTRFDRVIDIAENFVPVPRIEGFIGNDKVIVAGSTWNEDEEELDHYANTNKHIKFILAPHEIEEEHLKEIEKLFHHSVRYSQLDNMDITGKNTLIIDNIGMLSRLYNYAHIAYVGGGFGSDGIHNILEAAVFGIPVVFGPVFNKYTEAIELLEEGGAITIDNALELEKTFNSLLSDEKYYRECCNAAKDYVFAHKGATGNIMSYIQANRLLTN
ncbi:MAG: 3-deoxy-D-manno-octulosonic acid transferase [Chitinophagaceae bacterium]|nr:3-deoxy-D-manno-octulosonic acid transferase [Chitinophagaceae bacterium]